MDKQYSVFGDMVLDGTRLNSLPRTLQVLDKIVMDLKRTVIITEGTKVSRNEELYGRKHSKLEVECYIRTKSSKRWYGKRMINIWNNEVGVFKEQQNKVWPTKQVALKRMDSFLTQRKRNRKIEQSVASLVHVRMTRNTEWQGMYMYTYLLVTRCEWIRK